MLSPPRLEERSPAAYENLLYLEQPTERDLSGLSVITITPANQADHLILPFGELWTIDRFRSCRLSRHLCHQFT